MKTTLLVLAAGMGSRYGGLKQLDEVGPRGESLLDYSIYDAIEAGFDRVVLLIRRELEEAFKERVTNQYRGIDISFAYQELDHQKFPNRKKPWGTAHAILSAKSAIDGPFSVINADDYYGKDSFQLVHKFISSTADKEDEYVIAGYPITNTLSEFGSVSRGVCQLNGDARLKGIREVKEIVKDVNGNIIDRASDSKLDDSTIVSMNIWGLKPSIFGILERGFKIFLDEKAEDPNAEYLIPSEMNDKIADGQLKVFVYPTKSEWFGITYKEDKPKVQESLLNLSLEGHYPMPLW